MDRYQLSPISSSENSPTPILTSPSLHSFVHPPPTLALQPLCLLCSRRFPQADFPGHLVRHQSSIFPCNECFVWYNIHDEIFSHLCCSFREGIRHQYKEHGPICPIDGQPHLIVAACDYCEFTGESYQQLEKHIEWCHNGIKCDGCGFTTTGLIGKKLHYCLKRPIVCTISEPPISKSGMVAIKSSLSPPTPSHEVESRDPRIRKRNLLAAHNQFRNRVDGDTSPTSTDSSTSAIAFRSTAASTSNYLAINRATTAVDNGSAFIYASTWGKVAAAWSVNSQRRPAPLPTLQPAPSHRKETAGAPAGTSGTITPISNPQNSGKAVNFVTISSSSSSSDTDSDADETWRILKETLKAGKPPPNQKNPPAAKSTSETSRTSAEVRPQESTTTTPVSSWNVVTSRPSRPTASRPPLVPAHVEEPIPPPVRPIRAKIPMATRDASPVRGKIRQCEARSSSGCRIEDNEDRKEGRRRSARDLAAYEYVCRLCQMTTTWKNSVTRHLNGHHQVRLDRCDDWIENRERTSSNELSEEASNSPELRGDAGTDALPSKSAAPSSATVETKEAGTMVKYGCPTCQDLKRKINFMEIRLKRYSAMADETKKVTGGKKN